MYMFALSKFNAILGARLPLLTLPSIAFKGFSKNYVIAVETYYRENKFSDDLNRLVVNNN